MASGGENKVFCPYCGAKMANCSDNDKEAPWYWYQCVNTECRSVSPKRKTAAEAHKAAMKRASRWISVEDALPAEDMCVIGFSTKCEGYYPSLFFHFDAKEFYDETYPSKPVSITHWMPLPEAPEEDADDE